MAAIDILRFQMINNPGKLGTYEFHVDDTRRVCVHISLDACYVNPLGPD